MKRLISILLLAAMALCYVTVPAVADDTQLTYAIKQHDWDTMADSKDMIVHMINSEEYKVEAGKMLRIVGAATEDDVNSIPVDIHKDSEGNIYNRVQDRIRGAYPNSPQELAKYPYGLRAMEFDNTWAAGYTVEISGIAEGESAAVTVTTKYCRTAYKGDNEFWPMDLVSYNVEEPITNGVYTFLANAHMHKNSFTTASNRAYLYYISDFALSFSSDVTVKVVCENEALTDNKFDPEGNYKNEKDVNVLTEAMGDFYSSATVTYHDVDGNVLEDKTQTVANVTKPYTAISHAAYALSPAALACDYQAYKVEDGVHYCVAGWKTADGTALKNAVGTVDVYPVWGVDPRTFYTVTFKNSDGTVLSTVELPEGETPAYEGTPEMDDARYTYTFKGWDKELAPVTADTTYTAAYDTVEKKYTVTFKVDGEAYGEPVSTTYEGSVTLPENPVKAEDDRATYTFEKWVDAEGNDIDFTKITANVEAIAQFKVNYKTCIVKFYNTDGKTVLEEITVDYNTEAKTEKVPTKEKEELYTYEFEKWVDAEGNDVDLTAVKADMEVYPVFKATYVNPFTDVSDTHWAREAIAFAKQNGLMNGTAPTIFNPGVKTTRGMVVEVLYNLEKRPSVEGLKNPFTDVAEGQWYTDAVVWAANNKVVDGMTPTTFAPTDTVTREQFATILYRYASEVKKYDVTVNSTETLDDKFSDASSISTYAVNALYWCNSVGIVKGYTEGGKQLVKPLNGATRAEMAQMLMNFMSCDFKPADSSDDNPPTPDSEQQ